MNPLEKQDWDLVEQATKVIKDNYDRVRYNHTVGAAVRCKNGAVYAGVNVYSVHGACAEVIAIGAAISAGERDFVCIVAIGGDELDQIYPPCGNCRQFILEYAPDCSVIVPTQEGPRKSNIKSLIPYAYQRTD